MKPPEAGTRLYSPFFRQDIIVTRFYANDDWYFRLESDAIERKAKTAFTVLKEINDTESFAE